ncbi:MAG: hypothetical protein MJZ21_02155, partial [archaeon]|nr:hypothetical protein [archaeon]
ATAYPAADTNKYAPEFTFNNGFVMSATDFTTAYGKSISEGTFNFEDKNQMPVTAVRSGSDVTVTYDVAVDNEFTLVDSALGKVVMKVTAITDNVVTYTLTATGLATGSDVTADGHTVPGIEMICLSVINSNINILGVNGTEVVYNNNGVTDGKDSTIYNQDLYFVIKVISKN